MEKLFEGHTCKAEYDKVNRTVFYSFNGYVDIEEHKEMYVVVLEFMRKNTVNYILNDLLLMKGTFTMLNDWIIETFRPAVELGLKKSAMVVNEDVFVTFSANDAIEKIKLIQINVFKSIEEAKGWLWN